MTPLVVGLTGGIGCGKSHIRETLVELGAEGVDADLVAHEVMEPGGPAYESILEAFGRDLLTPERLIDRRSLGVRVFSDPVALARLERLVHPAVSEVIRVRVGASAAPAFVIEAIKLLEAGLSVALCDEVWVATCSEEAQIERLWTTRGMTSDEVRRRRANQMPAEEMIRAADRVIPTDGSFVETDRLVLWAWLDLGLPLRGAHRVFVGLSRVQIRIDEGDERAEAFYTGLGFQPCGAQVYQLLRS